MRTARKELRRVHETFVGPLPKGKVVPDHDSREKMMKGLLEEICRLATDMELRFRVNYNDESPRIMSGMVDTYVTRTRYSEVRVIESLVKTFVELNRIFMLLDLPLEPLLLEYCRSELSKVDSKGKVLRDNKGNVVPPFTYSPPFYDLLMKDCRSLRTKEIDD